MIKKRDECSGWLDKTLPPHTHTDDDVEQGVELPACRKGVAGRRQGKMTKQYTSKGLRVYCFRNRVNFRFFRGFRGSNLSFLHHS